VPPPSPRERDDRHRDRESECERERERDRDCEKERESERDREWDRARQRERERERNTFAVDERDARHRSLSLGLSLSLSVSLSRSLSLSSLSLALSFTLSPSLLQRPSRLMSATHAIAVASGAWTTHPSSIHLHALTRINNIPWAKLALQKRLAPSFAFGTRLTYPSSFIHPPDRTSDRNVKAGRPKNPACLRKHCLRMPEAVLGSVDDTPFVHPPV